MQESGMLHNSPIGIFIASAAIAALLCTTTFSAPHSPGATGDADTRTVRDTAAMTATEAAQKKVGTTGKIIAAVGTSAVVVGVTTYFLVNFFKKNDSGKDTGIPDPPDPPGYR